MAHNRFQVGMGQSNKGWETNVDHDHLAATVVNISQKSTGDKPIQVSS